MKGRERRRIPILTFHSLDDSGSAVSVPPRVFRQQMEWLRDCGYAGIGLGELFDAWDDAAGCPAKRVAITFDDGFRNTLESAAPVLAALGFRATLFAVAAPGGRSNDWPGQPETIPRLPLLSSPELRALADSGFEIGAHGLTHAALDALSPSAAEREIDDSKRALEDVVGRPVDVFAYPYGRASPSVREQVSARYRGACSVELGFARAGDDRHWLPRIDMYYFRSLAIFRTLQTPVGAGYVALRAAGRWLKRVAAI